jgi:pimeloyl-ACP methyl ester carboxylesterase
VSKPRRVPGSDRWRRSGGDGDPVAVLLPGTASTADFVHRAFASPLADAGFALITTDPSGGSGVLADQWAALDDALSRFAPAVVGGVSLGAHVVSRWAAARRPALAGLVLVMPAWTGPPDEIAGVSAATATDVERDGIAATLARLRSAAPGSWVVDELTAAWPRYTDATLAAALRATAASAAPSLAELAGLRVPCGVVGLLDDPMHPIGVARTWVDALPAGALVTTDLTAVGADRGALGLAAIQAWRAARPVTPPRSGPPARRPPWGAEAAAGHEPASERRHGRRPSG